MNIREALQNHSYTFFIIDTHTGEFTKYFSGSVISIIQQLERDPENSDIALVIKQKQFSNAGASGGVLSFTHDDHIYAFMPNVA